MKARKMLIFGPPMGQVFKDSMSLVGCQMNLIDVNFHLQKSLEIFDKNSADKIQSKKDKGVKVPCLMPIRVNIAISWSSVKQMR